MVSAACGQYSAPVTRSTQPYRLLLAAAIVAWQPSIAHAADEDTQLWVYAVAVTDLDDNTRVTFDASARWREEARGDEQQTIRFNLEQEVGDSVRIGGGLGVFDAGGFTEVRPHQELTVTTGRFALRTRIEQRFFDGADRMEFRFRQRVRYTQPLGAKVDARLDGEYFNLVQTQSRNPDAARDQWRGRVEIGWKPSSSLRLSLAYLAIYTPTPGARDPLNHVPQAWVEYRF
jgi:hypothetical protein